MADSEFLSEKLKNRPLNRRKLLMRMSITVLMAVLFGTVACVTFLLLEPIISERLYPVDEEQELIIFPEDTLTIDEEILPEDMIADEREMHEFQHTENPFSEPRDDDHIRKIATEIFNDRSIGLDEFLSINDALLEINKEARRSIVTVTGLTSDESWLIPFESRVQTTGVIIWDNERELSILANIVSVRKKILFYNSLPKHVEIEIFPCRTCCKAEIVTWSCVAYDS